MYPSHKFQPLSLYNETFSSYRPFWDKCTEWPQNYLEYYKPQGQTYHIDLLITSTPESQFKLPVFWDKRTAWPQNNIEHYLKLKLPHMSTSVKESHILLRFALRPAVIELQALNEPQMTLNRARSKVPHCDSVWIIKWGHSQEVVIRVYWTVNWNSWIDANITCTRQYRQYIQKYIYVVLNKCRQAHTKIIRHLCGNMIWQ